MCVKFIAWCIITLYVIMLIFGYLSYTNIETNILGPTHRTMERNRFGSDRTDPLVSLSRLSAVGDHNFSASKDHMNSVDLEDQSTKTVNNVTVSEIDTQAHTSHSTNSAVSPMSKVRRQVDSRGYIMPYTIVEQQTMASTNLWQLQILAKELRMTVVEPFANSSMFRITRSLANSNKSLRFGDYYDKETWNKMAAEKGVNPLVEWENFLLNAPREAVILITKSRPNLPKPLTITYNDVDAKLCNLNKIPKNDQQWLESMFNITRVVCYISCGNKRHDLSLEKFSSYVFGKSNQTQVTLITVGWLGIRGTRVDLRSTHDFAAAVKEGLVLLPSPRILKAYENYKSRYINHHKYVGIVFRTHHVLYFSPPSIDKNKYLLQCSKNLSHVLDKVREKWKIFLAFDMGTYGSVKLVESRVPLRDQIFLDVFNGSVQVEEREEMLIQAAGGITDRGFIAQLEKVIATNADCIVMLGKHTSFVRSSAALYMSLHPTNKCMVSICAQHISENGERITSTSIPDRFCKDET